MTAAAAAAWTAAMKFENRPDPYPFFDELRKTPVAQVADDVYVVTGYRELIALAHDPRISSDMTRTPLIAKPATEAQPGAEDLNAYGRDPTMITSDPPDHDRMRRQAMRHFGPPHSPDVIPSMETACQQIVNELLDKAKSTGKTRIDVVDDYAYPLPVDVICRMLGVPLQDEPLFHGWIADAMAGLFDVGPEIATEEGQARKSKGQASAAELKKYIIALVENAQSSPGPGMISQLVHDDGPDGPMSPGEIVTNTILLFVAGHDSTVNLISHTVLTLLRNPGSIDLLRARPELVPGAIEEALRLQSSVQFFPSRSATADIEISGTVIPKGSAVHLVYGAANRDPARFPDPNKFDPERADNEHVGWGRGIHVCFGGPLARLEVNTAIEAFLRRLENPRLVQDPPPYRISQVFRGPVHLLVEFDRISD
jgi:cytochrome P450